MKRTSQTIENEKRNLERYSLKAPAKIIPVNFGNKDDKFRFETTNICAEGAFFHSSHPLPEGTVVDVEIVLPLNKLRILKHSAEKIHLKINGKVIRSESEGIAVSFQKYYQIVRLDYSAQNQNASVSNVPKYQSA